MAVKSKLLSWAIMEDGLCSPGHLLSCKVKIIPFLQDEVVDDHGCMIGMDFMSEEGVMVLLLAVWTVCMITCFG